MATTPKNPDLTRDVGDTNHGLSSGAGYDDTSNARSTRPQDTAGRQSYGASGGMTGSSAGQWTGRNVPLTRASQVRR